MPLIQVQNLSKSVPDSGRMLTILDDVSFDVQAGETVAIIGASGSGKSTLLGLLAGLDLPTGGDVQVDGQSLFAWDEEQRAHWRAEQVGFVFQSFNLIPGLTTTENVAAPLLYDTGRAFWTRSARAAELLEAVGLGDKVGSPISRLSGGEQQRVAIARALSRRPSVILADEPTGALDVDTGNSVMTLLERQCAENGAALIIITHDLAVAGRAHTQYRLDHGALTPISVMRRQVGSLEEFGEVVTTPPTSPYPSEPTSHEGAS